MIHILLTGAIAAQATPAPTAAKTPAAPAASPNCRAPDGRFVMSCFPKGTVKKMSAQPKPHGGRLLVALPDAKATPTSK